MNISIFINELSAFEQQVHNCKIRLDEITNRVDKKISILNEQLEAHSSAKQ